MEDENAPNNEELEPEQPGEPEPVLEPTEPVVKKRGRPVGSKDRAPRRKIKILEEAISSEPKPQQEPPKSPQQEPPKPAEPPKAEPPPSPRSLHRAAAELILRLQEDKQDARRARLREIYTSKLASY